jgi:GNAT superfamily N-acetyltransferase
MHPDLMIAMGKFHHDDLLRDGVAQPTIDVMPSDELVLANGIRVRVRPAVPSDRDRQADLFTRLSPESRRRRYLIVKHALTAKELDYLSEIDQCTHAAFAALDERDHSIVGISRYVRHTASSAAAEPAAEVAVEVADVFQRMGVGTILTMHAVAHARRNGIGVLTATTLWENRPARALLRRLGFHARTSHGSDIDYELKLKSAVRKSR